MNANTDCGRNAYTCSYRGCATHVNMPHRPMTTEEAHAIIRALFGTEAETIIARSLVMEKAAA